MDAAGIVRRVVTKPRELLPRNPSMNPDVSLDLFISLSLFILCLTLDITRRTGVQFHLQ